MTIENPKGLPISLSSEAQESLVPDEHTGIKAKAALGAAAISLAFQQSPGNEVARTYAGLYALESTGSPLIAGATFGVATFAIEGVTGAFAAHAFRAYSEKIHGFKDKILSKFKRLKPSDQKKDNTLVGDSILALTVGSAGVVARRHYHDKNRTAKADNLTVAKSAGGIAAFSAILAYGGTELIKSAEGTSVEKYADGAIDIATDWKTLAIGGLAVGAYALAKKIKPNNKRPLEIDPDEYELIDVDQKGYVSVRVDKLVGDIAKRAFAFEQRIWDKKGYGSLESYDKDYFDQTRLFATIKDGECVGSTRVFSGGKGKTTPFIKDMKYYDEIGRESLQFRFELGQVEEIATSAFENTLEARNIVRNLWRLAYRDAVARGVDTWGIIIEPKRAKLMNRLNGFTFTQVGPETEYQGGMCAPHVMKIQDTYEMMRTEKPDLHNWFTRESLSDSF